MKIAHIVSTYPPYHGGMGNVACAMHEELLKRGHDSLVITPKWQEDVETERVVRLRPWLAFRNSAFIPQLGRYLVGREIIHLHYPFYGGAEAVAWFKWRCPEAKLVMTYHMDNVGHGPVAVFFPLYEKLAQKRILRAADLIMASSLDYARNCQLAKCPELKVQELPFGVAADFKPDLEKKGKGRGPLRLLFVGGLDKAHYFKGLAVLIEALGLCRNRVFTDVVGSGDLLPHYKELAANRGVGDQMQFHGSLTREQLITAFQGADVTVLPSVNRSEAFGLVLLESMACQTPVIASDLPGVCTVARDRQTGLLVSPKNSGALAQAIDTLAEDEDLRMRLGLQGYKQVEEHYRWTIIIERLEAFYRSLGKANPARSGSASATK
jgi:glycosyltransferase involved in cell wall biosynthesis